MQLIPTIDQIPYFYKKITEIYPDKPWVEWVDKTELTRRAFPHRVGQMEVENWFSYALTRWERQQVQTCEGSDWETLAGAMNLAHRVSKLCEAVREGGDGPHELEHRFRGAIQNPADLRAIHFELYMAELLKTRGCRIIWPVENQGEETFDLLVQPPGDLPEFELECKSFAGDKGASVTLLDGQRLIEACVKAQGREDFFSLFPVQHGIASILTINVSKEIPGDERKLAELAKNIVSLIKGEEGTALPSFAIEHSYCEINGDPKDLDVCIDAASELPGATVAFIAFGTVDKGWQGVRVAWSGKFTLFDKAEETAKKALKKQLTKTRPGAVALQFINDTAESIRTVNVAGNKYRTLAEKIFTRQHAALVVIASDIESRPILPAIPPYAPGAFMADVCKFAAFDNQNGNYPNSKLKLLFD